MKKKIIDEKTVKHVARLSRINLSKEEVALYQKQLGGILGYINKLSELDTTDTLPTSHPLENLKNVFRKDAIKKSLPAEGALKNAPARKNGLFNVPKIIE
jgi:aspartyl-tRNA(Asn)/glutamyl-tRNA(Gln) amidotransferase subunit C